MAKLGKRQEALMAKIAAQLAKTNASIDTEKVKEMAEPLYSTEAAVLEIQAAINFFKARVKPEMKKGESPTQFDRRYRQWRFKICKECLMEFAYAYYYEGVAFCSLECADANLFKETGLRLTRNRDVRLRWGQHHPAIVSADALAALRVAYPDCVGAFDVPVEKVRPTLLAEENELSDQADNLQQHIQ